MAAEAAQREAEAADKAARRRTRDGPPVITPREINEAMRLNQLGDAKLFIRLFEGRYCFDNKEERWYRYNGTRWLPDTGRHHYFAVCEELAPLYEDRARALGAALSRYEAEHGVCIAAMQRKDIQMLGLGRVAALAARRDALNKRAAALRDVARVKKVLTLVGAGANSLGLEGDEWNRHPAMLVCANTMVDLETGRSRQPSPWDYINMSTPVEWRGLNAECPAWDHFLDQVFEGNAELIDYVQRLAGYWLTGYTNIQEFWCLWGPRGRNGKGVFFRALRSIMGDYYTTVPVELLLDQGKAGNSSGPRQDLVNLRFRRLGVASESKKTAKFSDAAIKMLTGGDPIPCRGVYSSEQIEFIPECKLLFATNRIPTVDGGDQAFKQRLRVIPFYCQFLPGITDPEKKIFPMDRMLEETLNTPAELSGRLAWAVRGAMRLLGDGMRLPPPAIVVQETDEYMDAQDLVGEFLRECVEITDGEGGRKTMVSHMYASFRHWCQQEKSMAEKFVPSHVVFGQDLKGRPELRRVSPINKVFYAAVVKPEHEPPAEG
ncbi:putative DNA primase/helicase [Desulfobaculum xiamenense]|uniref:Putative DNA primase/helicase n=1 Tax=Desulfobaculum xiamenense TaxID=995050 RepID=A0A846QHG9_9BACT|nr:putative DNA primase/helicase [Desulfobaculum xiamenense]